VEKVMAKLKTGTKKPAAVKKPKPKTKTKTTTKAVRKAAPRTASAQDAEEFEGSGFVLDLRDVDVFEPARAADTEVLTEEERSVPIYAKDYNGTMRYIDAYCHREGHAGLHTQDLGMAPRVFGTGSSEYEYFTYVTGKYADTLLLALLRDAACQKAAGPEKGGFLVALLNKRETAATERGTLLLALLKKRFGGKPTAAANFEKFAEKNGMQWERYVA